MLSAADVGGTPVAGSFDAAYPCSDSTVYAGLDAAHGATLRLGDVVITTAVVADSPENRASLHQHLPTKECDFVHRDGTGETTQAPDVYQDDSQRTVWSYGWEFHDSSWTVFAGGVDSYSWGSGVIEYLSCAATEDGNDDIGKAATIGSVCHQMAQTMAEKLTNATR